MDGIWDLLVIGYWVVMGILSLLILIKLLVPQYIFSIDDICTSKIQVCEYVITYIQDDLGVTLENLNIKFNYEPNDELRGCYDQGNDTIILYHRNLDSVHSWIHTLVEEIHHSVFLSTKKSIMMYELYHRKVGYDNNPLEYAAKVYARNKFKTIHRNLKKSGLIRYKV